MDKCDCCLGADVASGGEPYCVRACPASALHYGNLEDLRQQVDEAMGKARLLQSPTEPSFYLT